ncbi:MAG: carbohydrate ABC transporter permease [Spirochaetaceae bacterium]|nr:MAG: carbohydrate ABC transporter permease [Spirochaetaceae bacterium]
MSKKQRLTKIAKLVVLVAFVFTFFLPIVSMFVTSLKSRGELYIIPPVVFPKEPKWDNYITAWTMISYERYVFNSLIISVFYTFPCVMGSCLTGYGFSRFRVKERNALFMLMLSTMMIPYMVTLVPLYLIVAKIGLTNKRILWLIWGVQGAPFLIFLFRQYFSTVPFSFEEAARIEGANRFQIFFRIMFPLVQTAVIIAAIFAFQWSWSDYLMPVLFLRAEKVNLAVKLANGYQDVKQNILQNLGMAGIVYYTAPIIIVFFALQKRFIAGLLSGGLKG